MNLAMLKNQSLAPESRDPLSKGNEMDISEISRERTLVDLAVARVRIVNLASEIDGSAAELAVLRAELAETRGPLVVSQGLTPASKSPSNRFGTSTLRFWRRSRRQRAVQWHVDEICGQAPSRSPGGISHVVRRGDSWALTMSGWAVPSDQSPAFTSARIRMSSPGGSITKQASIHLRDDVAAHFGKPTFAMSGFRFEVPMSELAVGSYALDLTAFSDVSGEAAVHLGRIDLV
jgi:hypothetical protein